MRRCELPVRIRPSMRRLKTPGCERPSPNGVLAHALQISALREAITNGALERAFNSGAMTAVLENNLLAPAIQSAGDREGDGRRSESGRRLTPASWRKR